jgi:2-C-methyl-D-erythritol 2,4-cyclodiphosphate synthase
MTPQQLPFRIGHGFDVHRFTEGNSIVLGGVKIPHTHAFAAHSDGDVLIHALCDALLGAIAAGDIGRHFPDNDAAYQDIDSCILLAKVYKLVVEAGYKIGNLDVTVIAQSPRLASYIEPMRKRLSLELDTNVNQINIKATTTEKLGYIGREEGIAVHSVVMLVAH